MPGRLGDPQRFRVGDKSAVAHQWARWLHNPCRLGVPNASQWGTKSAVADRWAHRLHVIFFAVNVCKKNARLCNFLFLW